MSDLALVMFDYDGVIADSLEQFTKDFIMACRENGFLELNSQEDALALFDGNVYETLMARGLIMPTINEILKSYEAKAQEHLDGTKIFSGMDKALEKIATKNKIFIITSNVSAVPKRVLQSNGITCVADVIGAEKEKSKIKKIQNLIQLFPELPAYYVGDTKGDIIEGQKAGVRTIGVAWGWHGREKLKESSPDYLVSSPQELASLLE